MLCQKGPDLSDVVKCKPARSSSLCNVLFEGQLVIEDYTKISDTNNTFDGLDEPVRPTHGVENADWTKKITKNNKKRRFSGDALISTVGCQYNRCVYTSKGGV